MIHALRAFSHRNYRLYFCGQSLGIIGYWIQQIAMAWLVYRLTGSAWLLGVTAFAGQIAVLVLAPFGGLWADRVTTHFALSVAMLALAGAGIVVTVNGISTITITIVDNRLRGRVAGFYTMAFLGMYPVGGLAAGALASWIGARHTLALGGACCMLCALWLAGRLPGLRREMRPIYERLGLLQEQKA